MAQDPEATRANSVASASSPGASTWNGGSAWPALFEPQHLSSPSGSTAHACCASDALTCRNWWFFGARHWPCRPTERERGVNRRPRQRLQPTNRTRTLLPQQRAVLSRCSAQVCESPALTWRMPCVPDGTLLCPWGLLPAGAGAWARRGRRKRVQGCRPTEAEEGAVVAEGAAVGGAAGDLDKGARLVHANGTPAHEGLVDP